MTVTDLHKLWEPAAEKKVTRRSQIRADWPDREIHLVGPDDQSGTFDYFNEVINGGSKNSRKDFAGHVDDNVIVDTIAADELALGYVGFTHYEKHQADTRALAVNDLDEMVGPGDIAPTLENVRRGIYRPLSRPLFLYIRASALDRPEVKQFVDFYARMANEIVEAVGGVRLTPTETKLALDRLTSRVLGTMYGTPEEGEMSLQMRMSKDR
jgi:phosphate transport system substrate-binding protein